MAPPSELEKVAPGPAPEVEDAERGRAGELRKERVEVLGDVVVARVPSQKRSALAS